VSQKNAAFYFYLNSVKSQPILIIFGSEQREEIRHRKAMNLFTSPVNSCCTTLGSEKVIFHYSTLISMKQLVLKTQNSTKDIVLNNKKVSDSLAHITDRVQSTLQQKHIEYVYATIRSAHPQCAADMVHL